MAKIDRCLTKSNHPSKTGINGTDQSNYKEYTENVSERASHAMRKACAQACKIQVAAIRMR